MKLPNAFCLIGFAFFVVALWLVKAEERVDKHYPVYTEPTCGAETSKLL